LVRELADRLPDVADADINYLRRGGLGGGGVAGRRRPRLRDLQEHHGVEHAGPRRHEAERSVTTSGVRDGRESARVHEAVLLRYC
jgi:hypothetical protein